MGKPALAAGLSCLAKQAEVGTLERFQGRAVRPEALVAKGRLAVPAERLDGACKRRRTAPWSQDSFGRA